MSNGTVVAEEPPEAPAYPYPTPREGARARRIVELVDKLLGKLADGEQDTERRKLLRRLRELAVGASYAYPAPPAEGLTREELGEVQHTLHAVARALGMKDMGDAVPQIGKQLCEIKKRIDYLAGVPSEEEGEQGVSFKGLL